jgi:hypothetical protein
MIRKKPGTGYNNNPALRAARDTHEYTPAELQELLKCATNVQYFAETYCYIITLDGKQKISLYDYQEDLLDIMLNGKPEEDKYNTIVLSPRQCISNNTKVTIDDKEMTAIEFFNSVNL